MTLLEAIIIAIVEGLTEFLPVSSTGHMIITEYLLGVENKQFAALFTVNIQLGAILSVIVLYHKKFFDFRSFGFYLKLMLAFIPAGFLGYLLNERIDALLENVTVVAWTTLLGGIVLVFVDKWFAKSRGSEAQEIPYKSALVVGLFQCLALIPGMSRSAATIIGGLTQKLNRKNAAEFSFFLAVPTLCAAAGFKLLKSYDQLKGADLQLLAVGNAVAFVVAVIAIKTFIALVTRYGFKVFGYYRIVLGLTILILLAMDVKLELS